jgi:hypothetical protein
MPTVKRILTVILMFVVLGAVYALAQQPAPNPAVKDIQNLAGKWSGWGTPASGSAFPIEVVIRPDGTYTSMMGATSGQGQLKAVECKITGITTEGQLSGPAGVAAGTSASQATVETKSGKQVLSGAGRNDAGPFNYELTKQ